jgi:hypothetical protein
VNEVSVSTCGGLTRVGGGGLYSEVYGMVSTVNSKLYNATLLIAKFENKVGRLQLASIAGCKTKSVEVFSVMFA